MPTAAPTTITIDKPALIQERADLLASLAGLTADMQGYPQQLEKASASGNLAAYGGILQSVLTAPILSTTLQVKLARVEALLALDEKKLPRAKKQEVVNSFKSAKKRAQQELATGEPDKNGTRTAITECIAALDEAISALSGK